MPVKPTVAQRPQDNLILEDKELVFVIPEGINARYEGNNHAIVAGCIRSVGITLVDSKDTSIELYCLTKSNWSNAFWAQQGATYEDIFNLVQEGIINGRVDYNELANKLGVSLTRGTGTRIQNPCGFK